MKIAYCISPLYTRGGMERIVSDKANWLADHGYDITIVIANQEGRPLAYPLDERINVVDFGIPDQQNERIYFLDPAIKQYRERLTTFLHDSPQDIVISTGLRECYFLHSIADGSKKIVEFHFTIHYQEMLREALGNGLLSRIKGKILTRMMIKHACKFDRIVALTDRDLAEWRQHTSRVVKIGNIIRLPETGQYATCERKEVIAVGRIHPLKGFDYLLRAWVLVSQKHPDWNLSIYGEAKPHMQRQFDALLQELHLPATILKGRCEDVKSRYLDSSIVVCPSRCEGFSLVLLEAASCGLPLISYDCPTGPAEIIDNGVNGILVPKVGDIQGLADAICRLIEDEPLRKQMGLAARDIPKRFTTDKIMHQWEQLFNELVNENA